MEQILTAPDHGQKAALIRDVKDGIEGLLTTSFGSAEVAARRGRKRKFDARDRRIWEIRQQGLSYQKIAKEVGIKRGAVQAVCRRQDVKCQKDYESYLKPKEALKPIGILLQEKKSSASRHPRKPQL